MSNHDAIRENARPGDILVSRGIRDPVSDLIAGLTKSNWSHSFFYIGDGKIIESERWGVRIEPLEKYLNRHFAVGLFRVTPEVEEKKIKTVVKAAKKMLGIPYGYFQLLYYFLLYVIGKKKDPNWATDIDPGMICSEMIARSYETIGIKFQPGMEPHQIEPGDFDDSKITVRVA